jgi:oligo-1,6-glucosidase
MAMFKSLLIAVGSSMFIALICSSCNSAVVKDKYVLSAKDSLDKKWWKEAVVYQIYPRSFKDSDGDGVGDLKGIISKLDYIKRLGVDAVWLNPIYSSPNDDNGYDVSDYRNIMKDFGTMEDFDALLKGMHERSIKLVMDVVVNHSSDEHEWFKQSRSSRTSPYRNYYHWWNAERGKPAPRYSLFDINHDAWKYDSLTNAYYLHYFSQKQPDLNWENPKLRQEVYDMMKFWADKGIDGFRLDAFQFCAKDTTFPAFPKGYEKNFVQYYAMGPQLHDYLKEMNEQVFSNYDIMSVAEGAGNSFEDAHNLVDADRKELDMAYAFEAVDIAKPEGYSLLHFKEVFSRWDSAFANKGWLSVFLANHDQARLVSRFGNDSPAFRDPSSKMLTTFLLSMRGTPYYYFGDELAMTNAGFNKIEDYKDMPTLNEYQYQKKTGGNIKKFMANIQFSSRDNGRTPMQWDTSIHAGFTIGSPWIKVNPNHIIINVAAQEKDTNSCLNYFRRMVKLRKETPALIYGKYTLVDKENPDVYAYTRELDGKKFLVLLNFTSKNATVKTGVDFSKATVLVNNYAATSVSETLKPYEASVIEL